MDAEYSNKFGMRHTSLKVTQKRLKTRRYWRRGIVTVMTARGRLISVY